jgi:hypothetical protein
MLHKFHYHTHKCPPPVPIITTFTSARHLSLSLPHSQVPATYPYHYHTHKCPPPIPILSHFYPAHTKVSIPVRGKLSCFVTKPVFTVSSCQQLTQPPSWRTTTCRLSAIAYSKYSKLPSTLEAVPPPATCERTIPQSKGTQSSRQ